MSVEEKENKLLVKRMESRLAGSTAAETILNVLKAGLAHGPLLWRDCLFDYRLHTVKPDYSIRGICGKNC